MGIKTFKYFYDFKRELVTIQLVSSCSDWFLTCFQWRAKTCVAPCSEYIKQAPCQTRVARWQFESSYKLTLKKVNVCAPLWWVFTTKALSALAWTWYLSWIKGNVNYSTFLNTGTEYYRSGWHLFTIFRFSQPVWSQHSHHRRQSRYRTWSCQKILGGRSTCYHW